MTIEEQLTALQNKIDNLNIHISVIEKDILDNPEADVEGKPSRSFVLNEFILRKNALEAEKNLLTSQG